MSRLFDWQAAARVTGLIEPQQRGDWTIERFTVERRDAATQMGSFFNTGRIVPPGEYTRLLVRGGGCMMSDTPDELRDLSELACHGTGRVLIHGLGLGCAVRMLLAKPDVEHIDVVEVDADVIAMVGPYFAGDRCTIHHGDCFTHRWPTGMRWDAVWHDIWLNLCTDDLAEHATLRRKFGRRCTWQGSWGYHFLRSQQRRERGSYYF